MLAYQQALCDMIASPELCLRVRRDPASLASFDLTERERRRLSEVARQRGMSTSCTLHRVNRVTPIYNYLPFTCTLLGENLMREVELYWREGKPDDLQFHPETLRFAAFLQQRIADGALAEPFLQDILPYELAINELRWGIGDALRLVPFSHAPEPLLSALANRIKPTPGSIASRACQVVLDARAGEIKLSVVTEDTPADPVV